ncbi:hypothetical protein STAQ_33730 [Allostella sp. ATCC 35155]|nr:hypothetical protein STAQ_33730 [Stella sp. ATCC 35155]
MRDNPFLTADEAAALLRLSPRSLEGFRYRGNGPRYSKAGRRVLYRRADIEAWIDRQARDNTHQKPEAH